MIYRIATPADRPALIDLLTQVNLLTADLPDDLGTFMLAFHNDTLVGAVGIVVLGPAGLLRSVAVSPVYRDQKIGHHLVGCAQKLAQQQGVTHLYLMTTTADGYFQRLGFAPVERSNVPEAITQTRQFSTLCPASSVVMKKEM